MASLSSIAQLQDSTHDAASCRYAIQVCSSAVITTWPNHSRPEKQRGGGSARRPGSVRRVTSLLRSFRSLPKPRWSGSVDPYRSKQHSLNCSRRDREPVPDIRPAASIHSKRARIRRSRPRLAQSTGNTASKYRSVFAWYVPPELDPNLGTTIHAISLVKWDCRTVISLFRGTFRKLTRTSRF